MITPNRISCYKTKKIHENWELFECNYQLLIHINYKKVFLLFYLKIKDKKYMIFANTISYDLFHFVATATDYWTNLSRFFLNWTMVHQRHMIRSISLLFGCRNHISKSVSKNSRWRNPFFVFFSLSFRSISRKENVFLATFAQLWRVIANFTFAGLSEAKQKQLRFSSCFCNRETFFSSFSFLFKNR